VKRFESLKNKKVVLFGAGNNGKRFFLILSNHGITPVYFVDNNANGNSSVQINGEVLPVFQPTVLLSENKEALSIIITPDFPQRSEVAFQLMSMELENYIYEVAIDFTQPLSNETECILNIESTLQRWKHKHYKNLKYISDRQEMLELLPSHGVCAEVGVADGAFSVDILRLTDPEKLHLIDTWNTERYGEQMKQLVCDTFSNKIKTGHVQINRGKSIDILNQFPDEYFDWVYVDTDHSYETTSRELEICSTKVKKDGIIAGHDFCLGNWETGVEYGVIKAVIEFCIKMNWELLYITSDIWYPSYALRRIDYARVSRRYGVKFCPACKSDIKSYLPYGTILRSNAQCPNCGAKERHRAFTLYLEKEAEILNITDKQPGAIKLLHFAPERVFFEKFSKNPDIDYYPVDIESSNSEMRDIIDIQIIDYPDKLFDYIICNHVLEHVPRDDVALNELCRVLKDEGVAYISVPMQDIEKTIEDKSYNTPELRQRYYGQEDHLRVYGKDFLQKLKTSGFSVEIIDLTKDLTNQDLYRYGLERTEQAIFRCKKSLATWLMQT